MRQLTLQIPRGQGRAVLEIAGKHGGMNLAQWPGDGIDGPVDLAVVHISNSAVGALVDDLQQISPLHITLTPQGVMPLKPPPEEAPDQVADVTYRSPIEVFLSGVQSVGSWKGFLGYAAAAGAVVWIGLFTNTIFLLTAAMLIAPFAGPAMNAAVATARGDARLLGRSVLRYFASLAVTILIAFLLSLILQQQVATSQMIETSKLSSMALLLPLVAGAAGALNLVQSERSSLVSGAATGMLVAASLAPPAGLIGMASVIGKWDMVQNGLFVLLLQIAGINFSGALIFRICGISAKGTRYARGKAWVFPATVLATAAALAILLAWQFWTVPDLQRSTRERRAAAVIQEAVDNSGLGRLVQANVRFTRASIPRQDTLLAVLYVQIDSTEPLSSEARQQVRTRLSRKIRGRLMKEGLDLTPLIDVNVLQAEEPADSQDG